MFSGMWRSVVDRFVFRLHGPIFDTEDGSTKSLRNFNKLRDYTVSYPKMFMGRRLHYFDTLLMY